MMGKLANGQVVCYRNGMEDKKVKRDRLRAIAVLGGLRGGPARHHALTPDRRREIAYKAAMARWSKRAEV